MSIAQMNWGRLRYPPSDPRLQEFLDSLDHVYGAAEKHPGFVWRITDGEASAQLEQLGFDDRMSATVSVWNSVEHLRDYTFATIHADYLGRRSEWFEEVEGPQLAIWNVQTDSRPDFSEAFGRLEHLKAHGPSDFAYGWTGPGS